MGAPFETEMRAVEKLDPRVRAEAVRIPALGGDGGPAGAPHAESRPRWPTRGGFVCALMGAGAAPLAALWLPGAVVRHGGAAFFVPLLAAMLVVALPLWVAELGLGRHYQQGVVNSLESHCRGARALGWWVVVLAAIAAVLTALLSAWTGWHGAQALAALARGESAPTRLTPLWGDTATTLPVIWDGDAGIWGAMAVLWLVVAVILAGGVARLDVWARLTLPPAVALVAVVLALAVVGEMIGGAPSARLGLLRLLEPRFSTLRGAAPWCEALGIALLLAPAGRGLGLTLASYLHRKEEIASTARLTLFGSASIALLVAATALALAGYEAAGSVQPFEDVLTAPFPGSGHWWSSAAARLEHAWPGLPSGLAPSCWLLGLTFLGILTVAGFGETLVTALQERFGSRRRKRLALVVGLAGAVLCALVTLIGGEARAVLLLAEWRLAPLGVPAAWAIVVAWLRNPQVLRACVNATGEAAQGGFSLLALRALIPLSAGLAFAAMIVTRSGADTEPSATALLGAGGVLLVTAVLALRLARRRHATAAKSPLPGSER